MVARDLRNVLSTTGDAVVVLTRSDLDITDRDSVLEAVAAARPDTIVNCAAYTKVDAAESDEAAAAAINGSGVGHLADAANTAEALLVQISTDFVFDGAKRTPYEPDDPTNPLSAYGRTKLLGEHAARRAEAHLVVRTSWLFGKGGPNFVEAMRGQIAKGTNPLRVVDDQRGCPTYTPHLAQAIVDLVRAGARGVVHYADADECSWFDFARAIVREMGDPVEVVPVPTSAFPRPAVRPAYSVLSTARYEAITGAKPASWREGLREYLA